MGDFASMTVEWDPWLDISGGRWFGGGVAEVAGNSTLLHILVLHYDEVFDVAVRWADGSEPRDEAVLREANRHARAHVEAHRKVLAEGGAP